MESDCERDQKIYELVQSKAQQVSQEWKEEIEAVEPLQEQELMPVKANLNLYDEQGEEILLFEDGIQVKAQAAQRQSKTKLASLQAQQASASSSSVVRA